MLVDVFSMVDANALVSRCLILIDDCHAGVLWVRPYIFKLLFDRMTENFLTIEMSIFVRVAMNSVLTQKEIPEPCCRFYLTKCTTYTYLN